MLEVARAEGDGDGTEKRMRIDATKAATLSIALATRRRIDVRRTSLDVRPPKTYIRSVGTPMCSPALSAPRDPSVQRTIERWQLGTIEDVVKPGLSRSRVVEANRRTQRKSFVPRPTRRWTQCCSAADSSSRLFPGPEGRHGTARLSPWNTMFGRAKTARHHRRRAILIEQSKLAR